MQSWMGNHDDTIQVEPLEGVFKISAVLAAATAAILSSSSTEALDPTEEALYTAIQSFLF